LNEPHAATFTQRRPYLSDATQELGVMSEAADDDGGGQPDRPPTCRTGDGAGSLSDRLSVRPVVCSPSGPLSPSHPYSLIVSCRRRGINPETYLTDVLRRLPHLKITEIDALLPAHWQPPPRDTG
jgi:hypothetical protein